MEGEWCGGCGGWRVEGGGCGGWRVEGVVGIPLPVRSGGGGVAAVSAWWCVSHPDGFVLVLFRVLGSTSNVPWEPNS